MIKKDKRVDAYIAHAADFAKPILIHLRGLVHAACPEVKETIKWGHVSFVYRGMLATMAAFKAHCRFGFWQGSLILGSDDKKEQEFSHRDRLTSLADLPPDEVLTGYIKKAMALNEVGVKAPKPARPVVREKLVALDVFVEALRKNKKAGAAFEKFSYSHKKEYIEWLADAKREETRQKRLATALQWLTEGKPRNWKYMNW